MPTAAPRVCTHPGCGELVIGTSRCRVHDHRRLHDKERKTAAERGYDSRWRKARNAWMVEKAIEQGWPYPLCEQHLAKGERVRALVVDHVKPHRGCEQLFWDRGNWMALCKQCHDRKTATEDGGFGRG